jgi:Calx-beta domain-containing protein/beta-propeller repeat-containing protein/uncharacterized protein DUF4214
MKAEKNQLQGSYQMKSQRQPIHRAASATSTHFVPLPYSVSSSHAGSRCAVTLLLCAVLICNALPLVTTTHAMKHREHLMAIPDAPSQKQPTGETPSPQLPSSDQLASAKAAFGRLPIYFEENRGQTDDTVRYLTRGAGYSLFLADGEAVLSVRKRPSTRDASISGAAGNLKRQFEPTSAGQESNTETRQSRSLRRPTEADSNSAPPDVLRMRLMGARKASKISGEDEQEGKSNYFISNDPSKWRTNVGHYARVRYAQVYAGIDQVYYGNQGQLEYDFVVAPHADHQQIRMRFDGAGQVLIDDVTGELVLRFRGGGEVRQQQPYAYQEVGGKKISVAVRYLKHGNGEIGFAVDDYDRVRPLVIDPVLVYSTYLGGTSVDIGYTIAVDSSGNAYLTGQTFSPNFPTASPFQPVNNGGDVFITKINAAGSALVYSTFLGGNGQDVGGGIAVDSLGNAYITGFETSTNFPTVNPIQPTGGGNPGDAFVTKINAAGSAIVYSTYLGGNNYDYGNGIALDSSRNAYITGTAYSTNFPTANPIQPANGGGNVGTIDAFVTKVNPAGSAFVHSTYLGGSGDDYGNGIAVDSSGNAYVTGSAVSTNFPTASPFQPTNHGLEDTFLTKLNPTGSAFVYSTYLGGSAQEIGYGVAVDSSGSAFVTGRTRSTNFPTASPLQSVNKGGIDDGFVLKMNTAGSALIYSTYLGGTGDDHGTAIALDSLRNAYVTGQTSSTNFPTASPFQSANAGGNDIFVTKLNPDGSALLYSTYLGGSGEDDGYGIAVDSSGSACITGETRSPNFPTAGPIQPANGGGLDDAFVAKFTDYVSIAVSPSSTAEDGATNLVYTFTRTGNTSLPLTVNFSVGGTATFNTDYTQSGAATFTTSSGTVTFAAASSTATVTINPTADITVEPNETVILTVTSVPPGAGYSIGSPSAASGTINNDDATPSLSINDVSVAEGNSGTFNGFFTVTLSAPSSVVVTVNFATANGTAVQPGDYQSTSGLPLFNPGELSKNISVPVVGNVTNEPNETFFVNLSTATNANISDNQGIGNILNDDTPTFNFSLANYSVSESGGSVLITVNRTGDPAPAVNVDYVSTDNSNPADFVHCSSSPAGTASSRCDFNTALGTLRFAASETSKTFNVLITQDSYVEGTESLQVFLVNPTGGSVLGVQSISTLQILDDVPETSTNPVLDARNFVRQHYHDFLNREPDQAGWDFWTDNIAKCNDPARRPAGQTVAQCTDKQRETTSGAFFLSPEFQYTGFYIYCVYKGSLGRQPTFLELMRDVQQVSRGIVVNGSLSGPVIEQNRAQFELEFIQRPEFVAIYGALTNQAYVDKLFQTTGTPVSGADKQALVNGLNGATETRASVLHKVVNGTRVISESQTDIITTYGKAFTDSQTNAAFVQMEYLGYLRRNSDDAGFAFWLGKMNFYGDFIKAEMVKSFLVSPEYLQRFAP